MGPGCGTAMLGGVGLGFANVVRAGQVGIVAAAGTGAQEAACLLDAAGRRRLAHRRRRRPRPVGATSAGSCSARAMRMLAADDATDTLLLVSKPPAPRCRRAALVDAVPPASGWSPRSWAGTAARRRSRSTPRWRPARSRRPGVEPPPTSRELEQALVDERRAARRRCSALYSGGSLAHEAATILEPALGPIGRQRRPRRRRRRAATGCFDLGEEEYTQGRPHPMVDLSARLRMLERGGRRRRASAACCSTSCSATARTPTRRGGSPSDRPRLRARSPGDRARVRHARATRRTPAARRRRCATPARSSPRRTPRRRGWRPRRCA